MVDISSTYLPGIVNVVKKRPLIKELGHNLWASLALFCQWDKMITSTKPAPNCLKILSALTFVLHCTTKQRVQIISEGAFIKGALMSESFLLWIKYPKTLDQISKNNLQITLLSTIHLRRRCS